MQGGLVELDMSRANLSCYEYVCKVLKLPVNISLSRETLALELGISMDRAKTMLILPWTMAERPRKTKCDLYECYVNTVHSARSLMWKHEDLAWIREFVCNVRGSGIGSFMHYIYEFMASRIMIRVIARLKEAKHEIACWNKDGLWIKAPNSEEDVIALAKRCAGISRH